MVCQRGILLSEAVEVGGMFFSHIKGQVSWFTLIIPALIVTLSTLVASFIPAIRAYRIGCVEALRG